MYCDIVSLEYDSKPASVREDSYDGAQCAFNLNMFWYIYRSLLEIEKKNAININIILLHCFIVIY